MLQYFQKVWRDIGRPSVHYSIGALTLGGFVAGIMFWGGFNTTLEATNSEKFCISCHEMQENVYQELRDRKVALFLDKLPQGVWEIRYELRAEVPGEFHALPVLGHAMYVPEIRCNGQEVRIEVTDA